MKQIRDDMMWGESCLVSGGEDFRGRTTKSTSLPGLRDECLAVKMDETTQDFRVRVSSKRDVSERLDHCKEILRTAMDGQPEVDEDSRRFIVQELLAVSDERITRITTTITIDISDSVCEKIRHFPPYFLNSFLWISVIKFFFLSIPKFWQKPSFLLVLRWLK